MMRGNEVADPATSSGEALHHTLLRLAQRHPNDSLLQIMERVDRAKWQTDSFPDEKLHIYAQVNGLEAVRGIHSELARHASLFRLDAPPRTQQWVRTGSCLHLRNVLSAKAISYLSSFCDEHLAEPGTSPIPFFDHPILARHVGIREVTKSVLNRLPNPLPAGAEPVLYKKRTLLRRTFPPNRMAPNAGNRNNQMWHQDSNAKFNDQPMVTLWIPLQDTFSDVQPGLEYSDAEAAYFSPDYGDYSEGAHEYLNRIFPQSKIHKVNVAAGDCIVFNGLTFHKTHTTETTRFHRDALLLRIMSKPSVKEFSANFSEEDAVDLG